MVIDAAPVTIQAALEEYATHLSTPEPPLLRTLLERTAQQWPKGQHMLSGALQGRLLHMLVRATRAKRVLEVGLARWLWPCLMSVTDVGWHIQWVWDVVDGVGSA